MRKNILLLFFTLFSLSAIHAEITSKLENGTLTISGTGDMPNYDRLRDVPWYSNRGKINSIVIEDGVTSIGIYAFCGCNRLSSVTIGNSVTSIGSSAFSGCSGLTSVTIPNSVTSIGNYVFRDCSGLTSVTIGNSVTSIGERAFWDCSGLTSITIPNSVTSIGMYAFSGCSSLTSITIPNSMTSIGERAFFGCSGLTSITIPNSVTSIGEFAFSGCSSLTSITIPNSMTSIGQNAFYNCSGLTSITIPNSVTSIEEFAFSLCSGLTSVTIPNSVTSIGSSAFSGCSGLTSVTIPNSVTSIGSSAFSRCTSLTSVTIPNSVKSIEQNAFYGCSGLTSITIPNSVTSIEKYAFYDCKGLTSITFERSTHPEFGKGVFNGVDKSIPIYVPFGSRAAYREALKDFGFSNIIQPSLSLKDGDTYTQDSQVEDVDVSFTRYFSTNWESIYLPFSLEYKDWKDDFEVARINGIHQYDDNDDGNIDRTILEFVKMKNDDSVIEPNTPYIIKAKKAGEKTISVENTTVYEAKANSIECSTTTEQFTFIGLYKKPSLWSIGQLARGKNYVMYKGNLSKLTTLSDIGPYCWYMKRENRDSAYGINNNNTAKEISIRVVGEETTGIANIQLTSPNTQTYDLNGRRVNENNLKPGMYVKNGRKVIIK